MTCEPHWYTAGDSCPYGSALPLSVTYPDDMDGWKFLSVLYGYVPWFVCFCILGLFVIIRGTREFVTGLTPVLAVGLTEVVKAAVKQQRPIGSCLTSCGMPSSHSATSVSLLVYLLLDAGYRVKALKSSVGSTNPSARLCPNTQSLRESVMKFVTVLGFIPGGSITQGEYTAYAMYWFLLLFPVGISRSVLSDHTPSQVLAGSLIGIVVAVAWFWAMLWFRWRFQKYSGRKFWFIFVHNYGVPEGWIDVVGVPAIETNVSDPLVASAALGSSVKDGSCTTADY